MNKNEFICNGIRKISPSLKKEIVAANSETITIAQHMLTHMRRIIDGYSICTTEIEDGKLSIGLIFYLSVVA